MYSLDLILNVSMVTLLSNPIRESKKFEFDKKMESIIIIIIILELSPLFKKMTDIWCKSYTSANIKG